MNRYETITTEERDKKEEMEHLKGVLSVCDYPSWALKKVTDNTKEKKRPTVGQRTKTTGVKWISHMWRESRKDTQSNEEVRSCDSHASPKPPSDAC